MRHLEVRSLYPEPKQKDTLMDGPVPETETHETRDPILTRSHHTCLSARFLIALLPRQT